MTTPSYPMCTEHAMRLASLEAICEGGFAEINRRLDRLNGGVASHEEEIGDMKIEMAEGRGRRRGILAAMERLFTILTLLCAVFAIYYQHVQTAAALVGGKR